MSKAKQRALEKYPLLADDDKEGLEALKYIGMECDCASEYNQVQESKQAYFIEGYHQAKKDLIEKGIEFLKDHLEGYDIFGSDIERSVESFKLAMKDE